ncbi:hypothetical protein C7408_114124 [Paraburkholderia caballeronis]|nr:hypothetical protein C7408_114124 [Paraburkholderia caballeronis]
MASAATGSAETRTAARPDPPARQVRSPLPRRGTNFK